jgi:hypothetical protein
MNADFKKCLVFPFLIVIFFVFVTAIHAYVLQGPHVLDVMIENLGKAKSLFVSHKIIFYRSGFGDGSEQHSLDSESKQSSDAVDAPSGSRRTRDHYADEMTEVQETMELEGSLRYIFSQAFRSDARSNDSERIFIFSDGKTLEAVCLGLQIGLIFTKIFCFTIRVRNLLKGYSNWGWMSPYRVWGDLRKKLHLSLGRNIRMSRFRRYGLIRTPFCPCAGL